MRPVYPGYAEDIQKLKAEVPEISTWPDVAVEAVYSAFSEDLWAASWLIVSEASINSFRKWLLGSETR